MFESRISAGAMENIPFSKKSDANISSWSYDMEGHAKKCVRLNSYTKSQRHAWPSIQEEMGSVGELSKVCSQVVLTCLYWTCIGRPDYLWSVNKLARAVTKLTKVCDKRLARLISHIHQSHMWIQTILLCVKNSTTTPDRIVSRFWFCGRPWRLEVNMRRNSVHFRRSNICTNKLDMQETYFCFSQFYRSWNNFSGRRFTHGWDSRAWSLGFRHWGISFFTETNQQIQRSGVTGKLVV